MRISLLVAFAGIGALYVTRSRPAPVEPPSAPVASIAQPAAVARPAEPHREMPALPVAQVERAVAEHAATPADPEAARGSISGALYDQRTGEPLPGVTVVVTLPDRGGAEAAITDDDGSYAISGLAEGTYRVTFYYLRATVVHDEVAVRAGEMTPEYEAIDDAAARDDVRIVVDHDDIKNIPVPPRTFGSVLADLEDVDVVADPTVTKVPGRTFEMALGAAAASQGDPGNDEVISSHDTIENTYIVEASPKDSPNEQVRVFESVIGAAAGEQHCGTGEILPEQSGSM